jgi:hypothetical protein
MDYSAWDGYEIDGREDTVLPAKVIVDQSGYVGRK